ncbi:MAG: hypothetical protein GXX96_30555 [Planctomycetaceae bacterium]|nr:hypothetical protein [Planctomycetaceae bacterium]
MRVAAIIALCISACFVYGILHDQVTARICVEYFTIGHPPLIASDSPTLLGVAWGIAGTWWVGLFLGLSLAAAARAGGWPKFSVRRLLRPVALVMLFAAACALVFGGIGFVLASSGTVFLVEPFATNVPAEHHVAFLTDLWAHTASYISGFLGGAIACYVVLRDRAKRAFEQKHPGRRIAPSSR